MARMVPNSLVRSKTPIITVFATARPPTISEISEMPKRMASEAVMARSMILRKSLWVWASSLKSVLICSATFRALEGSFNLSAM